MIEVQKLCKRYGDFSAVEGVSFQLDEGQTLALVGTSGSGKTTTLKMLNRLIEPTQGTIRLNGVDLRKQSAVEVRRQMGYVIQHVGLFPHYTVLENVGIVPRLLGWEAARIHRRAFELLDRLDLPPEQNAHKYPDQLSGGQQQRVGLARALAADPPIILMDEPFGALDPITRTDIRKAFRESDAFARKTTIIVTHDIEEAFYLGDLICVLDRGQIQQLGSPIDILSWPANDFVRDFVGGKRINLQWQVFRLVDLWEFLPAAQPDTPPAETLSPTLTVRQALDHLLQQEDPQRLFQLSHQEQRRLINMRSLLGAFHQFTQQHRG